jgi:hypothetical protein
MGSKQYACMLGLSRPQPYILYLKTLTARVQGFKSCFPQGLEYKSDPVLPSQPESRLNASHSSSTRSTRTRQSSRRRTLCSNQSYRLAPP